MRLRQALGAVWGDQRGLAAKLGVTENQLSTYFLGKARARPEFYLAVALHSGCSLDWLLGGIGEMARGTKAETAQMSSWTLESVAEEMRLRGRDHDDECRDMLHMIPRLGDRGKHVAHKLLQALIDEGV